MLKKDQNAAQAAPQPGGMYPPQQPGMYPQPRFVQQPQFVQQPVMQPQQFVQQPVMQTPQFVQQPVMQTPQFAQQPGMQPPGYFQQPVMQPPQASPPQYRPSMPFSTARFPPSSLSLPRGQDASMSYENDAFLSNLTGWSVQDIERLRQEFHVYANQMGVIDRDGFRKLYIASLLNMTWDAVEHDSEAAFRNFDINQTGFLDFNEYITACSRMSREVNGPYPPSQSGPMNPPYTY